MQIGPPKRLRSGWPTTCYTRSKHPVYHAQICETLMGDIRRYDLCLYIKNYKQKARTIGKPIVKYFKKKDNVWVETMYR